MIDYKYHEDKAIAALQEYVDGTYGQHYVGDGDVQTVDFWRSLGSLETTSRDTAIKYLARYGKKGGKNRKDILKTMHYCILMLYALDLEEKEETDYEISLSVDFDSLGIDAQDSAYTMSSGTITLSIDENIYDDIQNGKIEAGMDNG